MMKHIILSAILCTTELFAQVAGAVATIEEAPEPEATFSEVWALIRLLIIAAVVLIACIWGICAMVRRGKAVKNVPLSTPLPESHPPFQSRIEKREPLGGGKFLKLELLHYKDQKGISRTWEVARRTSNTHAAVMIATMNPGDQVVLIRQYRPPQDRFIIEFPAGLIDPGETAEQTAIRELREETGYSGTVDKVTPGVASSPGMSGELLYLVFMNINAELPCNQHPVADLQDGEEIQVFNVPKSQIAEFLTQRCENGDVIDSRLAAWSAALPAPKIERTGE